MLVVTLAGASGATTPAPTADETAIRDAENRWSVPSVTGDAAYLNRLLADDYVSVGETGVDHSKPAIVAAAMSYAKAQPGEAAAPMAASSTLAIDGDVAIVRHRDPQRISVDVFKKEAGAWRALYSRHTWVGAAAG